MAGGWLAVGIPEYRLPKDVLNAEIKIIEDLGVKIHLNTGIGKDIPFEKLQKDYDAVFIGCGTALSSKLDIPGEDMQGVIHGMDYLKRVNLGEKVFLGDHVAVVGGGNVAMDAVRTAIRTGSKDVFILYRSSRAEMPAAPEEIEEALEEGIKMEFLAAPKRIVGEDGKVTGVECTPHGTGRARCQRPPPPRADQRIGIHRPVDAVIPAIGQESGSRFRSQGKRHCHQ